MGDPAADPETTPDQPAAPAAEPMLAFEKHREQQPIEPSIRNGF
jgi:hypothetical protein